MTPDTPTIGSIWRESDKRLDRFVKVVAVVSNTHVAIANYSPATDYTSGFRTRAKISRFGKAYKPVVEERIDP